MEVMFAHSNPLPDCLQIRHILDVFLIALNESLSCYFNLPLEVLDVPADFCGALENFGDFVNAVDLFLIFLNSECATAS